MRSGSKPLALAVSALLLGCTPVGSLAPAATRDRATVPTAPAPSSLPPGAGATLPTSPDISRDGAGVISRDGAGVISRDGAGVISRDGASLAGIVRAPASVISRDGAGVISRDGAGYAVLAAPGEVPVRQQWVYLMNAEGKLVVDDQGEPIATLTDAEGRYRFEGIACERNLLLAVQLLDDKGRLMAVVPKGENSVDLGLVSTLSTTYIRERYVKGQADPAATLDKLPAEVERQTRERTAEAVAAQGAGLPDAFSAEKVVAAVEALRQKNQALDAQLETVKRLLIAAGQSDLGAGRVATEVALKGVSMLLPLENGDLAIAAAGDNRVWRLSASGRLDTLAGSGQPGTAPSSVAAKDAPLRYPVGLGRDADGRLLIIDVQNYDVQYRRLFRLRPDGMLEKVLEGPDIRLAGPGPDGRTWALLGGTFNKAAELVALAADGTRQVVRTFSTSEDDAFDDLQAFGWDGAGRVWFSAARGYTFDAPTVWRFALASGGPEAVARPGDSGVAGWAVDAAGHMFYLDASRALKLRKPDGSERVLASSVPSGFEIKADAAALMPDGSAYLAQGRDRVYRIKDGAVTLAAGLEAASGNAETLSLKRPVGVAFAPNGDMVVADAEARRVYRYDREGHATLVAGNGQQGFGADGPATQSPFFELGPVHVDGQGRIYVVEVQVPTRSRLRRIDPNGTIKTLFDQPIWIDDAVVAADGTVYLGCYANPAMFVTTFEVIKLAPDGTPTTIIPSSGPIDDRAALALGPQGELQIWSDQKRYRWSAGAGLQTLATADGTLDESVDRAMVVDAEGRVYCSLNARGYVARSLATEGAYGVLAGPGGVIFTGTTADDSLDKPCQLAFDAAGNLYIADSGHKQIKRVPKDRLR